MATSALVVTVGASNANAYVTLVVADQYHEDRPPVSTTWNDATNDEKNQAILWATTLFDTLIYWTGYVVNETQALLWPRVGMVYPSGYLVDDDVIPTILQEACAEYARQLLVSDRAGDSDVETQGIIEIKAGPVALKFKDSVHAKTVPDIVISMLPPSWGWIESNAGIKELVRT